LANVSCVEMLQPQVLSVFIRAKLKHFEYTTSLDEAIALIRSERIALKLENA